MQQHCDEEPRERELKYRLQSEADWRRLVECDRIGERLATEWQENRYYDSAECTLLRYGALLRIRRSGERSILTFKQGGESSSQPGYFDSVEVEADLTAEVAGLCHETPQHLWQLDLPPLRLLERRVGRLVLTPIASSSTERRRWSVDGFVVELDAVRVPEALRPDEQAFFEVEVETDEPGRARQFLEGLFESLGVAARAGGETKLEAVLRRSGLRPPKTRG